MLVYFCVQMAKSNTGKRPRVRTSDRGKRKEVPRQAQHRDFRDRFSKFQTRPWIVERGIDMTRLDQTPIPTVVASRHWEGYVARPPRPNRHIMAEYYASSVVERLRAGFPVLV